MENFKEIIMSVCAIILFFGVIKSIIPGNRYVKYMRFLLTMIFIVVIINGIRNVVIDGDLRFDANKIEQESITTEEQLALQIKLYLNERLNKSVCKEVTVINDSGNYYISSILLTKEGQSQVDYLKEITGLQEDQIYVES